MKSIQTHTYTNVVLTVIAILLFLLLIRPGSILTPARAQSSDLGGISSSMDDTKRNEAQSAKMAALNPNAENAKATQDVAQANREIADAIRETAKAQTEVARAISHLAEGANSK